MVFVTQVTKTGGVKIFKGGDALEMSSFCGQGVGGSRRACNLPLVRHWLGPLPQAPLGARPSSLSATALSSCGLEQTLLLLVPPISPVTCRPGSDIL